MNTAALTLATMLAFAANSLLCRMALAQTGIDAVSFTTLRLLSGALMLAVLLHLRADRLTPANQSSMGGNWPSALALFVYAAGFSWAYGGLSAGTGALLLFGAVQATMIAAGWWEGECLRLRQWLGLLLALAGLTAMMLPGLSAPPLGSAALMLAAGVAWGFYTLRARGLADPTAATAGNFLRASAISTGLSMVMLAGLSLDAWGVLYALLSGALASGLGYALWYAVVPRLTVTRAASVQLSVPVLAALLGAWLLREAITVRLALSAVVVLGGIALVLSQTRRNPAKPV